eukprot:1245497-Rhodomonas_salina.1
MGELGPTRARVPTPGTRLLLNNQTATLEKAWPIAVPTTTSTTPTTTTSAVVPPQRDGRLSPRGHPSPPAGPASAL